MSYIEKHLLPGETVLVIKRMSKKCFIPLAILGAAGIICLIISIVFIHNDANPDDPPYLFLIGIFLTALAIFNALRLLLEYWSQEFAITDKRCIIKDGIIAVGVLDMSLDKYEGIAFSQGLLGRMLNFGDIIATTGGVTSEFSGIDMPYEIRNKLCELAEKYKQTVSGTTGHRVLQELEGQLGA